MELRSLSGSWNVGCSLTFLLLCGCEQIRDERSAPPLLPFPPQCFEKRENTDGLRNLLDIINKTPSLFCHCWPLISDPSVSSQEIDGLKISRLQSLIYHPTQEKNPQLAFYQTTSVLFWGLSNCDQARPVESSCWDRIQSCYRSTLREGDKWAILFFTYNQTKWLNLSKNYHLRVFQNNEWNGFLWLK